MRTCLFALVLCPVLAQAEMKMKEMALALTQDEQAILEQTNAQRKAAGLPEFVINEKLLKAARGHSANMAKKNQMSHNLDGRSVADRIKAEGYEFRAAAENIAWNSANAAETVKLWMNSPGHRTNILNANYTEIGIAVAVNESGQPYWTQVFGTQ